MSKSAVNLTGLFIILVIFCLSGCAAGNPGKLKRVEQPTETGLRQDWQNDELYGYLVHRSADMTYVGILDENTVELKYTYRRTSGR